MTFGISSQTVGSAMLPTFTPDTHLMQLAVDIARLVLRDPSQAAQMVREHGACERGTGDDNLASAVTGQLDDAALHQLAGMPPGRDLLDVLQRHGSDGSANGREQLGRLRDALFAVASGAMPWAQAMGQAMVQPQFAGATTSASGNSAPLSEAAMKEQVKGDFKQEFAAKAADKKEFDAFMQQVFGNQYDKGQAELFRQRALNGDFGWLPDVKFVDAQTLGGANGAYNAQEGVVYINKDIAASDPHKAAQTFVEEAGHHLDAKLNTSDTQGDEGEMFRRMIGGEQLSKAQVAEIRADDDRGTITVDGKEVAVEFWNPFKAVANAAKAVGGAIADGAKAVGGAIADGAKAVGGAVVTGAKAVGHAAVDIGKGLWNGAKDIGNGVWGAAKDVGYGLYEMSVGFVGNLVQGNIGEAFSSVVRGFDKAVLQSTQRLAKGVLDSAQSVFNGVTDALGPVGKPLRWVSDRVFDIGQTVLDTTSGIARDLFRALPDLATGFISDVERAVKLAADGKWGDAAKEFGMAFVNVPKHAIGTVVDVGARALQAVASIAQTAVGVEPPARGLTGPERDYLKTIYGSSIDYDMIRIKPGGPLTDKMAPHTVGNTIYMPKDQFKPDGTLTNAGLETLGHEAGHVWQNQNGGGDYISNALGAQAWAGLTDGDRNAAYNWQKALSEGETFESMNDEERAKVMEDIGIALHDDGKIDTTDGYTAQQVAFLNDTADKVRHGEGAG